MRERTTWNRDQIVKLASSLKKAEDPRAMNQDHLSQQPAANKYEIGGPSEFGEDIAAPNWKAEYSGGEVKRNEIGMPDMRSDTFNHPEKTAAQQDEDEDDDFLEKKADVCLDLARKMLPKSASSEMVEDQAFAFMHMADADIVATAARLAAQDEDEDKKQSQQQQDKKEAGQIPENFKKKDDEEKGQQDKKEAGQIPENFKKKDDKDEDKGQQAKEAQGQQQKSDDDKKQSQQKDEEQAKQAQQQAKQDDDKKQSQQDEQQKKEAALNDLRKKACDALQQGDQQLAQQLVQQMSQVQQAPAQQQQLMSQEQAQQQIDQMLAQAQQGQQQLVPQQVMASDGELLDRMLNEQVLAATDTSMLSASVGSPSMDIQLEGPSMDMTEVRLGSEDEALTALFASHDEVQQAAHAHSLQTGMPIQASGGMTRTASTRTVGTRPTGGVAQLGGASAPSTSGGEIDKLSGLWASAPDVKSVFDT